jgi:hypothetical protein
MVSLSTLAGVMVLSRPTERSHARPFLQALIGALQQLVSLSILACALVLITGANASSHPGPIQQALIAAPPQPRTESSTIRASSHEQAHRDSHPD